MASNLRVDTILPSTGTTLGIGTASGTINFLGNSNITTTGSINAASATITGNLGVGGVLTYEDVTNIDSVGVITARGGIKLGATGANTLISGNATGIGIGTDSPGSPLEVNGGTSIDTATFNSHNANGVLINLQRNGINKGFIGSGKNISDATGGVDDIGMRSQANLIFTAGGDTERMRISSQGFVTKPNTPAFNVKGGNMTRTDTSGYICQFNNKTGTGCFDNGGNFNTSTYKFTAPVTGTYYFFTNIRLDSFSSGYIRTGFLSTNHGTSQFWQKPETGHVISYYNTPNNIKHISASTIMQLDVNDEVYVYQDPNSDNSFVCYLNESSFGGYLIG